jgi:hypothetical protein
MTVFTNPPERERLTGWNAMTKAGLILTIIGVPLGSLCITAAVRVQDNDEMVATGFGVLGVVGSLSVLAGVPLMIIGANSSDPWRRRGGRLRPP